MKKAVIFLHFQTIHYSLTSAYKGKTVLWNWQNLCTANKTVLWNWLFRQENHCTTKKSLHKFEGKYILSTYNFRFVLNLSFCVHRPIL